MTRRLALTPAIGLFTGLWVVSFGAVGMAITGVHGSAATSTNPCSATTTAAHAAAHPAGNPAVRTGAAHTGIGAQIITAHPAAAHTLTGAEIITAHTAAVVHTTGIEVRAWRSGSGARAARPAHLPVLLDVAAQGISGRQAAQQASHKARAATAKSSPPSPSASPLPVTPPAVTPDPSPGGGNVTPSTGSNPSAGSTSPPTPPVSPGNTNNSPTATPTPTATATPTPTSTTTPPPTATLCLSVQTLGSGSSVKPGGTVQYAIFAWLTSGTGGTANIGLKASPSSVKPTFSVCQPTGGSTCSVSGLTAGHHVEVQAKLTAAKNLAGHHITLTATATSQQASNAATATDKVTVESKPKHSSSSPTTNAGNGGTLPPASLPGGNTAYTGGTNPTGNLGSDFPQVSPSPNVSPAAPNGQHQHQVELTDLSAGLPLDVRLIGGQVIGLAILAAAVTIAVARLSLRRQPPRHGDDGAGS